MEAKVSFEGLPCGGSQVKRVISLEPQALPGLALKVIAVFPYALPSLFPSTRVFHGTELERFEEVLKWMF